MHHVLRNICSDILAWLFFEYNFFFSYSSHFKSSIPEIGTEIRLASEIWIRQHETLNFKLFFFISWIWIPWFGENKTDPNLSFDPWMLPLNSGIFDFHSRIFPHALKLWMMPPSRKECIAWKKERFENEALTMSFWKKIQNCLFFFW